MTKQLIVFDVDGVILNNKMGGFKDILVLLGKGEEVQRINKEYQRRKHKGPWGLEQLAQLYKDLSINDLEKITLEYCSESLTEGTEKLLNDLRKKSYTIGALSSNPQFIMDILTEILSLDFSEGTQLEFEDKRATGRIKKKVDRYVKAEILAEKIKVYGLSKNDVVVVGDSITDLPMAEIAGTFIAFRPKEDIVREKATRIVKSFQQLRGELL